MNDPYADRPVAVVTGSSTGIGAATAIRLAADGFFVVVHAAQNQSGAEGVVDQLDKIAGCRSVVQMCDFSDHSVLGEFVEKCFAWQGRVDVWVNNAGADVLTGDAADQGFADRLRTVLEVDVMSTMILSRHVAQRMQLQDPMPMSRTGGLIVNMGWDQAQHGMAGESGQIFAASKGAVMAATLSLAQTYTSPAVRINCVAPGWIQTAWGRAASPAWQIRATQESLLGRWGQPNDIAGIISFLAGPDGQFVNGQVIPVNGGFRYGAGFQS